MKPWLKPVLIILLTGTAYIPAMQAGYIWDDDAHVTENPTLRSAAGLKQLLTQPTTNRQYYPLTYAGFWLQYQLWGLHATGYHMVNIALHACVAVLIGFVFLRLGVTGAWWIAALFAVHPVHVESVAWISELKNVLSGVLYLLALLSLMRWTDLRASAAPVQAATAPNAPICLSKRWYVVALVLYVCALLSKTVTCSLPVVFLLLVWWKQPKALKYVALRLAPMLVLGVILGVTTLQLESWHFSEPSQALALSVAERVLIAGRALWFYAGKLVWPYPLNFIYPRWDIQASLYWQWFFPLAAVLVLLALGQWHKRWGRGPLVAVLYFAGTLVPALGFINVYPFRYSFVADHFQYLASIGLLALGVVALNMALQRLRLVAYARVVLALCVLLFLAGMTWKQCAIYKDEETLWQYVVAKNPQAWMAYNNLGLLRSDQGRDHAAEAYFHQALALKPDHWKAMSNLGMVLAKQGRVEEAMHYLKQSIALDVSDASALYNLGLLYFKQQDYTQASVNLQAAFKVAPQHAQAHYLYALILEKEDKSAQAAEHYLETLKVLPQHARANAQLAVLLSKQQNYAQAEYYFKRALQANATDASLYSDYGVMLARKGDLQAALDQFSRALALDPQHATAQRNYANIKAALYAAPAP